MYSREEKEQRKAVEIEKCIRSYQRDLFNVSAGYRILQYSQRGELKSALPFVQEILNFYKIGYDLREAAENGNYDHIDSKYMNRMLPYMILRFTYTGRVEKK